MSEFFGIFIIPGGLLLIFMLLSLIRLILGPTVPDRIVALDTINTLVVAYSRRIIINLYVIIFN